MEDVRFARVPLNFYEHQTIRCSTARMAVFPVLINEHYRLGRVPTLAELSAITGVHRGSIGRMVQAWRAARIGPWKPADEVRQPRRSQPVQECLPFQEVAGGELVNLRGGCDKGATARAARRDTTTAVIPTACAALRVGGATPSATEARRPHVRAESREGAHAGSSQGKNKKPQYPPTPAHDLRQTDGEGGGVGVDEWRDARRMIVHADRHEVRVAIELAPGLRTMLEAAGCRTVDGRLWKADGGDAEAALAQLVPAHGAPTAAEIATARAALFHPDLGPDRVAFRAEPPAAVKTWMRRFGMRVRERSDDERSRFDGRAPRILWVCQEPASADTAAAMLEALAADQTPPSASQEGAVGTQEVVAVVEQPLSAATAPGAILRPSVTARRSSAVLSRVAGVPAWVLVAAALDCDFADAVDEIEAELESANEAFPVDVVTHAVMGAFADRQGRVAPDLPRDVDELRRVAERWVPKLRLSL